MRTEPSFDHGHDFGQFTGAAKYGGRSLALNLGQFTERCYQMLKLQDVHNAPLELEHNRNIRRQQKI